MEWNFSGHFVCSFVVAARFFRIELSEDASSVFNSKAVMMMNIAEIELSFHWVAYKTIF